MSQFEKQRIELNFDGPPLSLSWDEDTLVDWAGGGTRYCLNGECKRSSFYFAYRFDRAVLSPDHKFAVIYESLGTKGLVICGNKLIRELNRSYYHAATYEYPIALFSLPDGTQLLAHCPNEFNKIEIEELESGRKLTDRSGDAVDFFHSRLQVSPGGTYLLSAGWMWHPLDAIQIFRVSDVLKNPQLLDQPSDFDFPDTLFEVHTATFQTDDILLLSGDSADVENPRPHLAGYSIGERKTLFTTALDAIPGTIMLVSSSHIVGFHEHPKLFDISSGKVVREWPDLKSGRQNSSIMHHLEAVPPLALDVTHKRFAIANDKQITVIQLD